MQARVQKAEEEAAQEKLKTAQEKRKTEILRLQLEDLQEKRRDRAAAAAARNNAFVTDSIRLPPAAGDDALLEI